MDASLNKGAAGMPAGGPKSDGAFLGRNADKNSANNDNNQQKTRSADSLDPAVLLLLRTVVSPFKDEGEDGPTTWRLRRLTKKVRRDGEIVPYERAKTFDADGLDVSTFDKLFAGLSWLSGEWAMAVVQGGKIDGVSPCRMRKIIEDDFDEETKTVIPKTITDKPCIILPIDIDDLIPPPGVLGLRAIALWVIARLPPEFHNVRCVAVASSSYGLKRGAHIRLWFMLDKGLTCAEKRQWLKPWAKIDGVKFIDIGLYTANQLVYCGAPLFENLDDDPLCDSPRLIVIDGAEEFVRTPHADRLKPAARAHVCHAHAPLSHVTVGNSGVGGDDNGLIRGAMAIILAAVPSERHDTIMRQAFNLAGDAVLGAVDPDRALRALIRAGTRVIPGARVITLDEVTREWNHALAVKHAEWQLEQPREPSSYDEEDL
jgi:hypothetical protein